MKVSIVIPTYNEKEVITECLKSLSKQSYKDMEIIVVEDGSSDGTIDILKHFHLSPFTFHLLRQGHKGAGAARNLGVKQARGEILVFIDADMTFDVRFLEKLTEPVRKNFVKGTFSKEEYVSNWDNEMARCWSINEGWEARRRHPKKYPKTQKVFRAILKKEFDRVGGFEPSKGYIDDWSLSEKLRYEATEAPGAIFYHKNPDNLQEIFVQAKWVGKRPYKLGKIGAIYALIRASLPESLWAGLIKSIRHKEPAFFIFKVVYDFGVFVGILEHLLTGKVSK